MFPRRGVLLGIALLAASAACAKKEPPPCASPGPAASTNADGVATPGTVSLHLAAWQGRTADARGLVENGTDVHAADADGFSPLHWAARAGHLETARLLLERGADPNASGPLAMTPLHWAAFRGRPPVIDLLVVRGADVNAVDEYGMTPLHRAASPDVVAALVEHSANLAAADRWGRTPLHVSRNGDVAQAFLERAADIRLRARDGRTPLEVVILGDMEADGLLFYATRAPARLPAMKARFALLVSSVSECPIEDLTLILQSPAAWVEAVKPMKVSSFAPGQVQAFVFVLTAKPDVPQGKHAMTITVSASRRRLGDLSLAIDTRPGETPEDHGKIQLGKGAVRPRASRTYYYLAFLAVPLFAAGFWWLARRRRRR